MATTATGLTADERTLLDMVRNIVNETELAVSFDQDKTSNSGGGEEYSTEERRKIKKSSAAVVRLWAEAFKGPHVFDIVTSTGKSLEIYAEMLEADADVTDA